MTNERRESIARATSEGGARRPRRCLSPLPASVPASRRSGSGCERRDAASGRRASVPPPRASRRADDSVSGGSAAASRVRTVHTDAASASPRAPPVRAIRNASRRHVASASRSSAGRVREAIEASTARRSEDEGAGEASTSAPSGADGAPIESIASTRLECGDRSPRPSETDGSSTAQYVLGPSSNSRLRTAATPSSRRVAFLFSAEAEGGGSAGLTSALRTEGSDSRPESSATLVRVSGA